MLVGQRHDAYRAHDVGSNDIYYTSAKDGENSFLAAHVYIFDNIASNAGRRSTSKKRREAASAGIAAPLPRLRAIIPLSTPKSSKRPGSPRAANGEPRGRRQAATLRGGHRDPSKKAAIDEMPP